MVYRVKLEVFEGPFDLLLHLIGKQKVDIRDVAISQITADYLAYIDRMRDLDLDVASDFLLVAATLLELKASSLLPAGPADTEDLEELSATESREVLVARLIEYRSFKNAAAELEARFEAVTKLYPREAGVEERFVGLLPDFLVDVSLEELAFRYARLLARRDFSIIDASHIGAIPISLELRIEHMLERLKAEHAVCFADLLDDPLDKASIVVTFLAALELYKRGAVQLTQAETFGSIGLTFAAAAA